MYDYTILDVPHVVDGDTLDVVFDVGFYLTTRVRLRLARINAPEVNGPDKPTALAAKQFVADWTSKNAGAMYGHTQKTDVFGRYLCEIVTTAGDNLSDDLLAAGLAVPYVKKAEEPQ